MNMLVGRVVASSHAFALETALFHDPRRGDVGARRFAAQSAGTELDEAMPDDEFARAGPAALPPMGITQLVANRIVTVSNTGARLRGPESTAISIPVAVDSEPTPRCSSTIRCRHDQTLALVRPVG